MEATKALPIIRVVMADDNPSYCEVLRVSAKSEGDIAFLRTVADGESALKACEELQPDVLILDLVMPKLDGVGVLEALRRQRKRPKVLVLTACGQEHYIQQALAHGADYYVVKPFDIPTLFRRIRQLVREKPFAPLPPSTRRRGYVEQEVARLITQLGVPPHYKGYAYLKEAISLVVNDAQLVTHMTKSLYPSVAARFNTSPDKVERAIRHAIETTWMKGNMDSIHDLFAYSIDVNKGKPTNSMFIARLADHVRVHLRAV